jgi:hypothetical protein
MCTSLYGFYTQYLAAPGFFIQQRVRGEEHLLTNLNLTHGKKKSVGREHWDVYVFLKG